MTKQEELNKLNKQWKVNCKCGLKKTAIQAVFGDGNANSQVVFIGEAPGKREDETGQPFVGAAGKFLNEILESIGQKREEIYITNIVKYRPPENRDPTPKEKDDCSEWLIAELQIITPKLIVLLGRHSMSRFFPQEKIGSIHGKLIIKNIPELGEQAFLPLYHPAAALYNGGLRNELLKDFKQIPKILKKL